MQYRAGTIKVPAFFSWERRPGPARRAGRGTGARMDSGFEPQAGGLADASAWLRARRARRESTVPQRRRGAIAVVVLLHLLLVLALKSAMQVRWDAPTLDAAPLVIRFDDAAPASRFDPALAVPEPATASPPAAAPSTARVPAQVARAPADPDAQSHMSLRLFEPDGALRLSREVVEAAAPAPEPVPEYRERKRETNVWRAGRPAIVYRPTRFERHWKPDRENLAQELVRKYPLLGLVIRNPGGQDGCPPNSLDPDCEGAVQPAFPEDPYPDDEVLR